MTIYKVLMYGDRRWGDPKPIEREMKRLIRKHGVNKLVIIEGGAPGADTLARIVADAHSVHVCHVAALWDTRHRSAGPQRNLIMAALDPDEAICFHKSIGKSKGSAHMMKILNTKNKLSSKLVKK